MTPDERERVRQVLHEELHQIDALAQQLTAYEDTVLVNYDTWRASRSEASATALAQQELRAMLRSALGGLIVDRPFLR